MELREAARLGRAVSAIGLGTWQLGADWGEVSEADATAILEYFAPLRAWLKEQNRGQKCGW